ncbi:MAG: GTP 3',8-cyclase MoaA [bacterium]
MRKLIDQYGRKIDYLRISVTDRCNLRCIYCMPNYGIIPKSHNEILTFEEIEKVIKAAVSLGVNKIKITGGEPLIRKGIVDLIAMLSDIEGIVDLSMTTNGIFLSEYTESLKKAGLKRINISLDTLWEDKYKLITKMGNLNNVLEGIKKAQEVGLFTKLNVVVIKGINDDEILDFVEFSSLRNFCVRFIEFMPTNSSLFWEVEKFISMNEVKKRCEDFVTLEQTKVFGSGPAEYYKIIGSEGKIGFISPFSYQFCSRCSRLRLTSDGKLRGCLHNGYEIDLRKTLRMYASSEEVGKLIKRSVLSKPKGHCMKLMETNNHLSQIMCQIGG